MKLNYKRTIFVGFAFFLICAFWQAYDNTIPLILTNKFGLSQTASGVVMALDNVLALFMLPLFGAISDRHRGKRGRRTPFILWGTLAAAILFVALSFVDHAQLGRIEEISVVDDPKALALIYDSESEKELMTPEGETYILAQEYSRDEFCGIQSKISVTNGKGEPKEETNPDFINYVVPARQSYAWGVTRSEPTALIVFIALLLLLLIAMATFRSPAVALMPDVTIKPLRSKANAVINLMGSAGGVLVLVLGMLFATSKAANAMMSYTAYFSVIAAIMLLALGLFLWQVREPRFVAEMQEESKRLGMEEEEKAEETKGKLGRAQRRSLIFLLASIVLWFMGYNAVTSKYSVYASNVLHKDYNLTLIIAQAAAIIAYLPVGFAASRVGRKKTILAGIVMLGAAFTAACFLRENSPGLLMNAMFALAGIGWATINVNSFPMVVEMCRGSDVGKYTGIYYTASMAAQTVTPMISGYLMDKLGMTALFPYAAVFVALAFVTMLFVLHGDNKPAAKSGLEALNVED